MGVDGELVGSGLLLHTAKPIILDNVLFCQKCFLQLRPFYKIQPQVLSKFRKV